MVPTAVHLDSPNHASAMTINCDWARALSRYDCRRVKDLSGSDALEIGTPFSLHDGTAVVLYVLAHGNHQIISDNGDTLAHFGAMGLDVWKAARLRSLRKLVAPYGLSLEERGDLRAMTQPEHAPFAFAQAVSGILVLASWAAHQLGAHTAENDLAAAAEPFILARNPNVPLVRHKQVVGASNTVHTFDFLHGHDLIDVVSPAPQSTGSVMRKVGDVLNGPFLEDMKPLIVVDDRRQPGRAAHEIGIISSLARAMPLSRLLARQSQPLH